MKHEFIAAQLTTKAGYSVTFIRRMPDVGRQGFYEWKNREVPVREHQDAMLAGKIGEIMAEHRHRLGVRRVRHELARGGAPGETWGGDITSLDTCSGWAYLDTVTDCYSRK